MRTTLFSIPFILAATTAVAQDLPNSLTMSCAAASQLVRDKGEVVIASGPNVFQRFIAEPGACFAEQVAQPAWIPTADQSQCLVGYHCQERIGDQK